MTIHEIVLFLHIIGLAGMFAGIGVSMGVLHFAKKADDVKAVRSLLPLGALGGKSIPAFSLIILATGVYMVEDDFSWDVSWIEISLAAFVVLFTVGQLINARRMRPIGMEAGPAPDGPIPDTLRMKLHDPVLETSERTMTMATIGIVYLMVAKPNTAEALIAMAVAIACGLMLSAQAWTGARTTGSS